MNQSLYYVGAGLAAVLVILLIMQCIPNNIKSPYPKYILLVDTPKGLVQCSSDKILRELRGLYTDMYANRRFVVESEALNELIGKATSNLESFLKNNPIDIQCEIEYEFDFTEDNELTPTELRYRELIQLLGRTIEVLRYKSYCSGHINLTNLYAVAAAQEMRRSYEPEKTYADANKLVENNKLTAREYVARAVESSDRVESYENKSQVENKMYGGLQDITELRALSNDLEAPLNVRMQSGITPYYLAKNVGDHGRTHYFEDPPNTCLGITEPDEVLANECLGRDLRLKRALDGKAHEVFL
jgi:hypothetical protein